MPIPPPDSPPSFTPGSAGTDQDALYREAMALLGPSLGRLTQAYERDPDRRKDLMQDIHFALWRSFATFDGQCSLRTWVYRVAHNVATSHALRDKRRRNRPLVGLEVLERENAAVAHAPAAEPGEHLDDADRRAQLLSLIERLAPVDRQIIMLYLEGIDAVSIGTITGLSRENVSTKVHRIKRVLAALRAKAERRTARPEVCLE